MTHIIQKCPHCGARNYDSVYGYVKNPIGVPLGRCPRCGKFVSIRGVAEWEQMEDMTKYLAIHPRGKSSAFFLAIPVSMALFFLLGLFMASENTIGLLFLLSYGLSWCLSHWFLTFLHANSEAFREIYCRSILRTRNPRYRALLEQNSMLFGEEFPKWVPLTKASRAAIEKRLEEEMVETDIEIPSLFDPRNSI